MENSKKRRLRSRLYDLLENPDYNSHFKQKLNLFFIILISLNVIAVLLESVHSIHQAYALFFYFFEIFSIAIFTLEYVSRIWCVAEQSLEKKEHATNLNKRLRFLVRPYSLIDLIVILPFYLSLFFTVDLRILRLFRILRILKFSRYFSSLSILGKVLKSELIPISTALAIMFMMVLLSSSCIYLVEKNVQPEVFSSIPAAMWWSIVTLSTVGYGDVVPLTLTGKLIGTVMMILGVGMVALPAGMFASRFSDELHRRQDAFRNKVEDDIRKHIQTGQPLHPDSLEHLRETLNLSEEEAQAILHDSLRDIKQSPNYCPHCGKPLS